MKYKLYSIISENKKRANLSRYVKIKLLWPYEEQYVCFVLKSDLDFKKIMMLIEKGRGMTKIVAASAIAEKYERDLYEALSMNPNIYSKKTLSFLLNDVVRLNLPLIIPKDKLMCETSFSMLNKYTESVWVMMYNILRNCLLSNQHESGDVRSEYCDCKDSQKTE